MTTQPSKLERAIQALETVAHAASTIAVHTGAVASALNAYSTATRGGSRRTPARRARRGHPKKVGGG